MTAERRLKNHLCKWPKSVTNSHYRRERWPDELPDALTKDYKKTEDLIGGNGLLKQLTKKLLERAIQAEILGIRNTGKTLQPATTAVTHAAASTWFGAVYCHTENG